MFFAVFNSSTDVQLFLTVLNNKHFNLRFTCVEALGFSSPFLDAEVKINEREFDISAYRQPIFTGLLSHFNGIAPLTMKQGLISCLLHSANSYLLND